MFFKNAKFYQVVDPVNTNDIEDKLSEFAFRGCGSQELSTLGWGFPAGSLFALQSDGNFTFKLVKEEKILPVSVVNSEVLKRIEAIEVETGAPVGKKAREDIKQETVHQLLPQAFSMQSFTWGCYLAEAGLVVVDSATDAKAETFLAMLRKTLGSLPIAPLSRRSISADLTALLSSSIDGLTVLDEVKFISHDEDQSKAHFKNQDLSSDEVSLVVESGKQVQKLAIEWDETLSCMLSEDGSVSRIRFSDVIAEQNDDIPSSEPVARIDADLVLNNAELARFANWLIEAFELSEDLEDAA